MNKATPDDQRRSRLWSFLIAGMDAVRRHPLILLGAFVLASIGAIATVSSYLQKAVTFFNTELTDRSEYELLSAIDIRVGMEHLRAKLGVPVVEHELGWRDLKEAIYARELYTLQLIYDADEAIVFYGVLGQDSSFRPRVPDAMGSLGASTYAGLIAPGAAVFAFPGASSGIYIERTQASRATDYRVIYLAYVVPQGIEYDARERQFGGLLQLVDAIPDSDMSLESDEHPGSLYARALPQYPDAWNTYRASYRPNGFGVGDAARFIKEQQHALDSLFHFTIFGAGRRSVYGPPGRNGQ